MSLKELNIYLSMMIAFLFNCCAFYSMSGSIPPHIKSISIPLIENDPAVFGLAEEITDGIQKKINDEGILKLIDKNADSILKGSIKKITDGPYTYNKQESVSEYRFKVDQIFSKFDYHLYQYIGCKFLFLMMVNQS